MSRRVPRGEAVGEPDAGDRHVRFDERGWETERWPLAPSYRAHPRLYPLPRAGLDSNSSANKVTFTVSMRRTGHGTTLTDQHHSSYRGVERNPRLSDFNASHPWCSLSNFNPSLGRPPRPTGSGRVLSRGEDARATEPAGAVSARSGNAHCRKKVQLAQDHAEDRHGLSQ